MTDTDKEIYKRIQDYRKKHLGKLDSQKTPVSVQLDMLRPVFQEIASEKGMSIEDVFVLYMDMQSDAASATDARMQDIIKDMNSKSNMPFLY